MAPVWEFLLADKEVMELEDIILHAVEKDIDKLGDKMIERIEEKRNALGI